MDPFSKLRALQRDAVVALGDTNWRLLWRYGKVVSGPDSGRYVSSLTFDATRRLVEDLARGAEISVCLMNRPDFELEHGSSLRLIGGRLLQFP